MLDLFHTPGLRYVGDITDGRINEGQPLPVFEPVDPEDRPGINSPEGWNALADRQNRSAFIAEFGRAPVNDTELRTWVLGMLQEGTTP